MENASKALIMAGGILIGIIIVTLGVYLFQNSSAFSQNYEEQKNTQEIAKFNSDFDIYLGREDITIHEIVSVANLAKNYNTKKQAETDNTAANHITVNISPSKLNLENYSPEKLTTLITENNNFFTCKKIEYQKESGRVKKIEFEKIKEN